MREDQRGRVRQARRKVIFSDVMRVRVQQWSNGGCWWQWPPECQNVSGYMDRSMKARDRAMTAEADGLVPPTPLLICFYGISIIFLDLSGR